MVSSGQEEQLVVLPSIAGNFCSLPVYIRTAYGLVRIPAKRFCYGNPRGIPQRINLSLKPNGGYSIIALDTLAPPLFLNRALTLSTNCPGGPKLGLPVCATINPGVFNSSISQADADAKASNAANAVLFGLNPGPCCASGPTEVQDFTWAVTGGQTISGLPGATFGTTGSPSGVATGFAQQTLVAGFPGIAAGCAFRWIANFCNPWPAYNLTVSMTWVATGLSGNDSISILVGSDSTMGNIITTTPPIGTPDPFVHYPIPTFPTQVRLDSGGPFNTVSGTWVVIVPATSLGASILRIQATAGKTDSSLGSAIIRLDLSNVTVRPLIPPVTTQPCSIISVNNSPANDYFAACQVITGAAGTVNGTNANATMEPGEPTSIDGDSPLNYSVWYCWTAPANATKTFKVTGSGAFQAIAAYTGAAVGSLTLIAGNSQFGTVDGFFPSSQISFAATAGTTYRIQIASEAGSAGAFTLTWS